MNHQRYRIHHIWALITVHLILISGCATTNRVTLPGNDIPVGSNFQIVSVILRDGEIVVFDRKGGMYIERIADGITERVIAGNVGGKNIEIDPGNVLEVRFEQAGSGGGSFASGFVLGLPVGALAFYLILVASFRAH